MISALCDQFIVTLIKTIADASWYAAAAAAAAAAVAATERITALELSISHDCFKVKKYCNEQWNIIQAAAVAAAAAAVAAAVARASEVVFFA